MERLKNQVAIVTGGGRGIGGEIYAAFAAEGARVAVVSRSEEQIDQTVRRIAAAGGGAIGVAADVTVFASVESMVRRVERELGPVDILMNNAGSNFAIGPVSEVDPAAWWQEVTTNLLGAFHTCRAVLGGMLARGRGRIINMTGAGATSAPAREWVSIRQLESRLDAVHGVPGP